MTPENIIEKFSERLGDTDFIQPAALIKAGLFGSATSVRNSIKKGLFPCLRVSSHRLLIPKESVLEHLRKSFSVVEG